MTTGESVYLCYDLKGIQAFIFAVPRLRYICGGSALLDKFDRKIVPALSVPGTKRLFSGGGKGAFYCDTAQAAQALQAKLVETAHEDGMGIYFGVHEEYSEAAHLANRSFPYLPGPDELNGYPCPESGLFPTSDGVHPMIRKRHRDEDDRTDRYFEDDLLKNLTLPGTCKLEQVQFFHDVDADSETPDGIKGANALGNRNRWAVIYMDGNNIGAQHREASTRWAHQPEKFLEWLAQMSQALDACSRRACQDAIQHIIHLWAEDNPEDAKAGSREPVTLPVRPLLVGGDDIAVLCHTQYAVEFVKIACQAFEERSRFESEQARKKGMSLWPATNGCVTLTAGILFAPVSLPLAAALPYTEQLLASAKSKTRNHPAGEAAPACVDWESVTEGLLISPAARRQSELLFEDKDMGGAKVNLTCRPYTLQELEDLSSLADHYRNVPATIRHQVLGAMKNGFWERMVFAARLGKHQGKLANDLVDIQNGNENAPGGRWKREAATNTWRTDVIDALLLLEEDARIKSPTIK